jgi:hypothetical protein
MRTATKVAIVGALAGHASGHGARCAVIESGVGWVTPTAWLRSRCCQLWHACRVFDVGRVMELNGKNN